MGLKEPFTVSEDPAAGVHAFERRGFEPLSGPSSTDQIRRNCRCTQLSRAPQIPARESARFLGVYPLSRC